MDECIREKLTAEQREQLQKWIWNAIRKHNPSESDSMALLDSNKFVQQAVMDAVRAYLTDKMNYKIVE